MTRPPAAPAESATTVKSLIKSFDVGRAGIQCFRFRSRAQMQTVAPVPSCPEPPVARGAATTRPIPGRPMDTHYHPPVAPVGPRGAQPPPPTLLFCLSVRSPHATPVCLLTISRELVYRVSQRLHFLGSEASCWHPRPSFFWGPCPWHAEVPQARWEPVPQLWQRAPGPPSPSTCCRTSLRLLSRGHLC